MESLRNVQGQGKVTIRSTKRPFSNFDFVEQKFSDLIPLKRILSQCRVMGYNTIVEEDISSVGFSAEEDRELLQAGFVLDTVKIKRISSKCAYVALRICLSMLLEEQDVSCVQINEVLHRERRPYHIGDYGLDILQIKVVLNHFKVRYKISSILVDNSNGEKVEVEDESCGRTGEEAKSGEKKNIDKDSYQIDIGYNSFLYGRIESGFPAMLGFTVDSSKQADGGGHIIPVIGHTFNEDMLVSDLETAYFRISKNIQYIPSELWVSTYICHDDNFGSYYCLPR